jgi:hypothetical protein
MILSIHTLTAWATVWQPTGVCTCGTHQPCVPPGLALLGAAALLTSCPLAAFAAPGPAFLGSAADAAAVPAPALAPAAPPSPAVAGRSWGCITTAALQKPAPATPTPSVYMDVKELLIRTQVYFECSQSGFY